MVGIQIIHTCRCLDSCPYSSGHDGFMLVCASCIPIMDLARWCSDSLCITLFLFISRNMWWMDSVYLPTGYINVICEFQREWQIVGEWACISDICNNQWAILDPYLLTTFTILHATFPLILWYAWSLPMLGFCVAYRCSPLGCALCRILSY